MGARAAVQCSLWKKCFQSFCWKAASQRQLLNASCCIQGTASLLGPSPCCTCSPRLTSPEQIVTRVTKRCTAASYRKLSDAFPASWAVSLQSQAPAYTLYCSEHQVLAVCLPSFHSSLLQFLFTTKRLLYEKCLATAQNFNTVPEIFLPLQVSEDGIIIPLISDIFPFGKSTARQITSVLVNENICHQDLLKGVHKIHLLQSFDLAPCATSIRFT